MRTLVTDARVQTEEGERMQPIAMAKVILPLTDH